MPPGITASSPARSPTQTPPPAWHPWSLPPPSWTTTKPTRLCRHVLRIPSSRISFLPPRTEEEAGGPGLRSPVSLLGIGGVVTRSSMATGMLAISASWPWPNWASTIVAIAYPIPRPRPPWPARSSAMDSSPPWSSASARRRTRSSTASSVWPPRRPSA